jgi:hypothetical protein
MNWQSWRFGLLALVLLIEMLILVTVLTTRYGGDSKTYWAIFHVQGILVSCEAYRENPASGNRYPADLSELHNPPFGGPSFLHNGEQDLIDPWGNPYRYAVVKSRKGGPEIYVWSEHNRDGKLKLVGAKRTGDGKTELFGRSE